MSVVTQEAQLVHQTPPALSAVHSTPRPLLMPLLIGLGCHQVLLPQQHGGDSVNTEAQQSSKGGLSARSDLEAACSICTA